MEKRSIIHLNNNQQGGKITR